MQVWHKELGFREYPLDPRSNPDLVGVEKIEDELKHYIVQGNMCLLSGPTGSGKTSMLKRLERSMDLDHLSFVYISADGVHQDFVINDAISGSRSFWEKLTFSQPKNVVILLDESHIATRRLTESIKSYWNRIYKSGDKCIQSVIVSQIEERLGTNFSGSFADRLGQRTVIMPKLGNEELKEVLKKRLAGKNRNYIDAFSQEALDYLMFNSDGSVRQMLEYADSVFKAHAGLEGKNPLLSYDYRIPKEMIFNALQMSGLVIKDKSSSQVKYIMKKLNTSKRYRQAVEMFEQFGALSAITLAEKLDVTKKTADTVIAQLAKWDALVLSHEDDEIKHYVLAPRLAHELVRV